MKTETHFRLNTQLEHDLARYFESGIKATDEERSILHAVLCGIENALNILVHTPNEHPNGTIETVMATRGDLRPTPEVKATERWNDRPKLRLVKTPGQELEAHSVPADPHPLQTARDYLTSEGFTVRAVLIDEETGGFEVACCDMYFETFEHGHEVIAFANRRRREQAEVKA